MTLILVSPVEMTVLMCKGDSGSLRSASTTLTQSQVYLPYGTLTSFLSLLLWLSLLWDPSSLLSTKSVTPNLWATGLFQGLHGVTVL
jgi:hypothetical protein